MPKMKVSGNLAAQRDSAASGFFKRTIKKAGATPSNPLAVMGKVRSEKDPDIRLRRG